MSGSDGQTESDGVLGGPMSKFRGVFFFLLLAAFVWPGTAGAQQAQSTLVQQTVARIVARETEEMKTIQKYAPLVETYVQKVKSDPSGAWTPNGDRYFLGRADFAKGVEVVSLDPRYASFLGRFGKDMGKVFDFKTEFLPRGFLQMIYVDDAGLDTTNYKFEYVRQEFLGEVRTLVFDVTPVGKSKKKGRFLGRIGPRTRLSRSSGLTAPMPASILTALSTSTAGAKTSDPISGCRRRFTARRAR